jgi:hypothetical protein
MGPVDMLRAVDVLAAVVAIGEKAVGRKEREKARAVEQRVIKEAMVPIVSFIFNES